GNDEIFEQFQTGYSGAPYYPKDSVNDASGEEIAMIGIDGSRLVVHDNSSKKSGSKSSELDAAVKYITAKCAENRIRPVRPMWLPTIPKNIYPDEIPGAAELQNSGITAVYGLVDHPDKQRQFAASIALDRCSNLIIAGSAGMGKTTLIETMLVSLLGRYTAEQVQFYIYDFSGRTLKMFNNAPHCGFVAFSDDNEGVVRTFRFIDRTINERKALFNESNVGSYTEYVKTAELPLILFIIDNFVSFSELYPNMSDDFIRLTRDCAKYGIQTIISVSNLNDVRSKARQNFSNIITLVMNEKGDYRDAWGVSAEFLPKHCKGRGLTLADGQLLEYQTALPVRGENETERNRTIAEMASNLTSRTRAARIAVLPHDQTYSDFLATNHIAGTVPIGYITSDISVYSIDLHDIFCYAVSDVGTKGISLVLDNTIEAAKAEGADIIAIKMKNDIKITGVPGAQCYKGAEGIREAVTRITGELKERAAVKRQFLEQEPEGDFTRVILGQFRKVFVIIDSMSEFLSEVYTNAECEDIRKVLETAFKKSGGMGMYFFAGYDQASHSGTFGYAASKNFVSNGTGIHLGGCYDKQRLFNVNMPISKLSKPLDYFTGYTIAGGDGVNIFVPHC
ncbi:MAG: hypothetical protein IK093_16780, partial [Ruminiclostridium sp.]|nr:hypothetical protein [Ruminiclostridium sp.]